MNTKQAVTLINLSSSSIRIELSLHVGHKLFETWIVACCHGECMSAGHERTHNGSFEVGK